LPFRFFLTNSGSLAKIAQQARLIAREQLRSRSPTGLILEIEIGERLTAGVADDEARLVVFLDRPGWREAAALLGCAVSKQNRDKVKGGLLWVVGQFE
jgi:hypothetical protein